LFTALSTLTAVPGVLVDVDASFITSFFVLFAGAVFVWNTITVCVASAAPFCLCGGKDFAGTCSPRPICEASLYTCFAWTDTDGFERALVAELLGAFFAATAFDVVDFSIAVVVKAIAAFGDGQDGVQTWSPTTVFRAVLKSSCASPFVAGLWFSWITESLCVYILAKAVQSITDINLSVTVVVYAIAHFLRWCDLPCTG
tara:strand:- start:30960 stop:31559 length:600 start_codon:yes stop_codon:yes gene_type:complete